MADEAVIPDAVFYDRQRDTLLLRAFVEVDRATMTG